MKSCPLEGQGSQTSFYHHFIMLNSFPHVLRDYGLDVDVRVLLELFQTMEMGLVTNLGSLFDVGQHLIVRVPSPDTVVSMNRKMRLNLLTGIGIARLVNKSFLPESDMMNTNVPVVNPNMNTRSIKKHFVTIAKKHSTRMRSMSDTRVKWK